MTAMFTITKATQHVEVAHLYEHIQAIEVSRALSVHQLVPLVDFTAESETLFEGRVMMRFTGTAQVRQVAMKSVQETDNAIVGGSLDISLALAQLAAEYKSFLHFNKDSLWETLRTIAATPWEDFDSLSQLLPKAGSKYHEVVGDTILTLQKKPEKFTRITVDIFLNDDAYSQHPATVFVFDQLARIYLECLFSACLSRKISIYWQRTESRRNSGHMRRSLVLTVAKGVVPEELHAVVRSQENVIEDETFNQKFQTYLERFADDDDMRLGGSYMELYRDYGLLLGKRALKLALKKGLIGDLTKALGAEIR